MSDLPVPEPTDKDEELALEFIRIKEDTNLRGTPEGDATCENCHFYANPDEDISYCWHERLEIMVGGEWWCDRWEEIGGSDRQMTPEQVTESRKQWYGKVEDNQWVNQPKFGEQCNGCLYYLNPDDSVSYCWHPKLQVGVGFDHWCTWWEAIPGQA